MQNERETATILAALRYWQRHQARACREAQTPLYEDDIATEGGTLEPLDESEIDDLCERINTDGPPPILAVIIEGGMVQSIVCNRPQALGDLAVLTIDYDVDGAADGELTPVPQRSGNSTPARCYEESVDLAKINLAATLAALSADEAELED